MACGGRGKKFKKFRASGDVGWPKPIHLHNSSSFVLVEMYGFWPSDVTTCSKLFEIFTTASTCHDNTTRQVSSFSDFVWILYNLKILSTHVTPHVTTPTWSSFHASSWIQTQHTPRIMNTIFRIKKSHYFMYLQFKFGVAGKMQRNRNN